MVITVSGAYNLSLPAISQVEHPVISEENTNTTTQISRPKRNRRPVERLHPYVAHVNNRMEPKREQTNILRVERRMSMYTTILPLLF